MKKIILAAIAALILSGCQSAGFIMPGDITVDKSEFDGVSQIKSVPAWVYKGDGSYSNIAFGYRWVSSSPEYILIKARLTNQTVSIDSNHGLQFNIDGRIVKLSTNQTYTDFNKYTGQYSVQHSTKEFPVKLSFAQKLIDSKSVKVKMLSADGYLDGDFKVDNSSSAIESLKNFIDKVNDF
ncbi:lipoprotein [Thalassotalea sp. SU-HH00458]|uniref:lipoprotein n=1 Tax=Thalassotalea sp. SU-HH00458 TaxID=3127657 RepID=UPI00310AF494